MKKIFDFAIPREPQYEADAAVVWCFDYRFGIGLNSFLGHLGITKPDVIRIAGSAKSLANAGDDPEKAFLLNQVRASIRLHNTKRVILTLHSDCGAYGGLAAFNGDARAEAENHASDLKRAAGNLRRAIPGIEVLSFVLDFDGVWEV
jgi:hypothetical protein